MKKLSLHSFFLLMLIPLWLNGGQFQYIWNKINVNNGLSDNLVLDINADKYGNIWVLSSGGLDLIRNNKVFNVEKTEGYKGRIMKHNGLCYVNRDGKTYLCSYPFSGKAIEFAYESHSISDTVKGEYYLKEGFLYNRKHELILDKRISGFVSTDDRIYAFNNLEGVFYTRTSVFSFLDFGLFNEPLSDIAVFRNRIYMAAQSGQLFEFHEGNYKKIDFGNIIYRSPGKFFKSDSALFAYTGRISEKGGLTPYANFYYCFDINDSCFLQLGYVGFGFLKRGGGRVFCSVKSKDKFYSFVNEGGKIYIFSNTCYYSVDPSNGYRLERHEKRVKVSQRNAGRVIQIAQNSEIRVFKDFQYKQYLTYKSKLKIIKDVRFSDNLIFVFGENAFSIIDARSAEESFPVYYNDLGFQNKYVSSDLDTGLLFLSDGHRILRCNYKVLLSSQTDINTVVSNSQLFTILVGLRDSIPDEMRDKFSLTVLYRDGLAVARSNSPDYQFPLSKFSPGVYRLSITDVYGNILFDQIIHEIGITHLVLFWILISVLILSGFFAIRFFLIYRRKLRDEQYGQKDLAYTISLRQKLSVSIPHLYNNLFNSMSVSDEEANVEKYNRISDFSSMVLNYNSKDKVTVNEELQFCLSYFSLYKSVKPSLRFISKISSETGDLPDDIQLPTFLLQPILENSFRRASYGDKRNSVYLHLKIKSDFLEVLISDDFSVESSGGKKGGHGIKIVQERMQNMKFQKKVKSEIIWSFRKGKPGFCTKIKMPYEKF